MTKHWTRIIAAAAVAWAAAPAYAETLEVTSPDGKIIVTVKDDGGQATYAVAFEGEQVIAPSKLGMLFAEHHGFPRRRGQRLEKRRDALEQVHREVPAVLPYRLQPGVRCALVESVVVPFCEEPWEA